MLRVGLTGGLGSGKSTVGAMLGALGAHVLDADAVGRELMEPGQQVYREIVAHFGPQVVQNQGVMAGHLDRAELARLAFECGRIEELNGLVHPAVIAVQASWLEEIGERDPTAIAVIESALIFETRHSGGSGATPSHAIGGGWNKRFDRIILVTAPEQLRIRRFVDRAAGAKQISESERRALEEDARRRMRVQLSDDLKIPYCDFLLDNSGTLAKTEAAVGRIYAQLREAAIAYE